VPKVSVIMNCFNGERYLKEAIDSIYAQTFEDWEILFFDNNSTDKSASIARNYDEKLKYYYSEETISLGHARKKALEMVSGEWIGFLDTDDVWDPDNLQTQLSLIDGSKYVLSYAGIREFSETRKVIRESIPLHDSGDIFEDLLLQFDINMVTPLIRRQAIIEHQLSFDPIITASEEYNLFMRLAAKGPVCSIKKILGAYRISANSLTNRQISKWAFERRYTLNQLQEENPGIREKYIGAFKVASDRGDYYESCYLMRIKKYKEARKLLTEIRSATKVYNALFFLAHFPYIWNIAHSQIMKRHLSRVLWLF